MNLKFWSAVFFHIIIAHTVFAGKFYDSSESILRVLNTLFEYSIEKLNCGSALVKLLNNGNGRPQVKLGLMPQ